jgi:hypothetical protein
MRRYLIECRCVLDGKQYLISASHRFGIQISNSRARDVLIITNQIFHRFSVLYIGNPDTNTSVCVWCDERVDEFPPASGEDLMLEIPRSNNTEPQLRVWTLWMTTLLTRLDDGCVITMGCDERHIAVISQYQHRAHSFQKTLSLNVKHRKSVNGSFTKDIRRRLSQFLSFDTLRQR